MASDQTALNRSAEARRRRFSDVLNRRRPAPTARRTVGLMKLLLPAAAIAVAGLTVAWPQLLPGDNQLELTEDAFTGLQVEGLVIENPRYVGTDSARRPYHISAESASRRSRNDGLVHLAEPAADIRLPENGRAALKADAGTYDQTGQTMALNGQVALSYNDAYRFFSETVNIDLRESTATGTEPVRGIGPGSEITAEGFRLKDGGKHVIFTGRSRAVLSGLSGKSL